MTDELEKGLGNGFNELDDEVLDSIAGGFIYHDAGDPAAHRKETFYVLDDTGNIILRFEDVGTAKH